MAKSKIYSKGDILQFLTVLGDKEMSGKELTQALVKNGVITAELKAGKIDCRFTNFMRAVNKMLGKDATIITRGVPNSYRLAITQDEARTRLESYVESRRTKTTTPKEKKKKEVVKVEEKGENTIISCARKIVDYYDNRKSYSLEKVDKLLGFIQTSGFNAKSAIEFVLRTRKEDIEKREQELSMKYLG